MRWLALLLGLLPAAAPAEPCGQSVVLEPVEAGFVELSLSAPCLPYARVDIAYGPFTVTEEASVDGTLAMRLPRLSGIDGVSVQAGDTVHLAALPPSEAPAPGYVALIWAGEADLGLALPGREHPPSMRLGFPLGAAARRVEILRLAPGSPAPALADIAIGGAPCAESPVRAALLGPDPAARVPLVLPAPGCDAPDGVLRLPLALPDLAP